MAAALAKSRLNADGQTVDSPVCPFVFPEELWVSAKLALFLMLLFAGCAPAPARILVDWTTATEVDTAGFNVYRSTQPDGTFVKVNANLIPASTDPLSGGKYRYEDLNVTPGQTYYYKLEDVELGGTKEEHGPIKITAAMNPRYDYLVILGGAIVVAALGVLFVRAKRRASTDDQALGSSK